MRREWLLRLYPRAWRERYGDEFLATIGDSSLHAQQLIDIVLGAIDARLSADIRRATMFSPVAPTAGGPMTLKALIACDRRQMRFSTRDSLIGSGVMIGATFLFMMIGMKARRAGWLVTGEMLINLSFSGSLMLSMPFWLMKGQPWKAQTVIVGGTLSLLAAISYLASAV